MINRLFSYVSKENEPCGNIALESYFLDHVQEGECILYLWQNQNTVVIGRNQNAWNECAVAELESAGGTLARRLSGGGAVFHDLGNLNFTFLVRAGDYDVAKQTRVILHAVRALGIEAEMSGRNDLTIDGRKFSGHAFYRHGICCYHHGTIMLDVDTAKLSSFLTVSAKKLEKNGVKSVHARVANLRNLRPDLAITELEAQLIRSFCKVYGLPCGAFPEDRIDKDALGKRRARFADWNWRLGKRSDFPEDVSGRFRWGSAQIGYHVDAGLLRDVVFYSDGLEADFLAKVSPALEGCRYDIGELTGRLMNMGAETDDQKEIVSDLCRLFTENGSDERGKGQ